MKEHLKEYRFKGFPVSEGIAIGIPFFLTQEEEQIPEFPITIGEVDDEIARYRKALFSSREDLRRLQSDLVHEGSTDVITIIDAHIQMLEDPMMTTQMEEKIRQMLQNTESVFHSVMSDYETRFSRSSDAFFQQRLIDVMDLAKRVLGHLCPNDKVSISDIPFNSVVFAQELIPSYSAAAHVSRVSAFVTQGGGGNSHAALIARAKGIPYVSCVDISAIRQVPCQCVIVDGQTGDVIVNPGPETLGKYQQRKTSLKTSLQILQKELQYDAETIDGFPVRVYANIGHLNDLDSLSQAGADGIGLFRTEYLFFQSESHVMSEESQYRAYIELLQKANGAPVVIRVFDVGGDKTPEFYTANSKEDVTALGCRGIRYLIRHPEIFKIQLRALLRAAAYGDVRILLPLISDICELIQVRQLIAEVGEELKNKGVAFKEAVPLGCMIEVPSAVLICDVLAKHCDFFSIGTNDLVQYTLGIDRSNPMMSDSCYPAHPSVVRMIKMVVTEARRLNRPVSICGEIASNPLFIPLLLGLGVSDFSCSPRYIPQVKKAIRQYSLLSAYDLAQRVLQLSSSVEVSHVLLEQSALSKKT
ncbi:MAG: phosphoenolpyruvate--protein phosphotransferase [Verrucomicrobia bacterium]|nr:phosphoenolpyruvate--protein phosphotransferase [Verrucomicrobiota bacterium]